MNAKEEAREIFDADVWVDVYPPDSKTVYASDGPSAYVQQQLRGKDVTSAIAAALEKRDRTIKRLEKLADKCEPITERYGEPLPTHEERILAKDEIIKELREALEYYKDAGTDYELDGGEIAGKALAKTEEAG